MAPESTQTLVNYVLGRLRDRLPIDVPTAIVAAHPDDETLGAGSSLRLFDSLLIVHVTDGAPINLEEALSAGFATAAQYGEQRRRELSAALAVGGARAKLCQLVAPDQGAAYQMAELVDKTTEQLKRHGSRLVITHAYEGGHPDHDATSWVGRTAASRVGAAVIEMSAYYLSPDGERVFGRFRDERGDVVYIGGRAEDRELRNTMLRQYTAQKDVVRPFFDVKEAYRAAPPVDSSQPPYQGTLYYETQDWGMDGRRFCDLVQEQAKVAS